MIGLLAMLFLLCIPRAEAFVLLSETGRRAAEPEAREIERLVGQLGRGQDKEREEARRRLETVGGRPLPALRKVRRTPRATPDRRLRAGPRRAVDP